MYYDNRSYTEKLEEQGKPEKCLGFENLIGKATAQFVETHLHGDISDMAKNEKMEEIRRLKRIQKESIDPIAPKKLIGRKSNK